MTIIAWSCIGLFCTAWLEESSKHVSIPSETTSRLHSHHNSDWDRKSKTGSLTPSTLISHPQALLKSLLKPFLRYFQGPSQGPSRSWEALERPLWAPTLLLHSVTRSTISDALPTFDEAAFDFQAKSQLWVTSTELGWTIDFKIFPVLD